MVLRKKCDADATITDADDASQAVLRLLTASGDNCSSYYRRRTSISDKAGVELLAPSTSNDTVAATDFFIAHNNIALGSQRRHCARSLPNNNDAKSRSVRSDPVWRRSGVKHPRKKEDIRHAVAVTRVAANTSKAPQHPEEHISYWLKKFHSFNLSSCFRVFASLLISFPHGFITNICWIDRNYQFEFMFVVTALSNQFLSFNCATSFPPRLIRCGRQRFAFVPGSFYLIYCLVQMQISHFHT